MVLRTALLGLYASVKVALTKISGALKAMRSIAFNRGLNRNGQQCCWRC
jgi:hypothetical protein